MDIYLMGYMASGKSTVGPLLAKQLEYDFIDFDAYISQKENLTIPEIFKNKGEIYFRKKEAFYLEQLLTESTSKKVVALGGGTPCYGSNMQKIKESNILSIYLNVGIKDLTSRLWNGKENRPLVTRHTTIDSLEEFVRKHLFERSFFYNQASKVFKVNNQSTDELVKEIIATLF